MEPAIFVAPQKTTSFLSSSGFDIRLQDMDKVESQGRTFLKTENPAVNHESGILFVFFGLTNSDTAVLFLFF